MMPPPTQGEVDESSFDVEGQVERDLHSLKQCLAALVPFTSEKDTSLVDQLISKNLAPYHREADDVDRICWEVAWNDLRLHLLDDFQGSEFDDAFKACFLLATRYTEKGLGPDTHAAGWTADTLECLTVNECERVFPIILAFFQEFTHNLVPGRGKALHILRMCTEISERADPMLNFSLVSDVRTFLSLALPDSDQSALNLKSLVNEGNEPWIEGVGLDIAAIENCCDDLSVASDQDLDQYESLLPFVSTRCGDEDLDQDVQVLGTSSFVDDCRRLLKLAREPWSLLEKANTAEFLDVATRILSKLPRRLDSPRMLNVGMSISQYLTGERVIGKVEQDPGSMTVVLTVVVYMCDHILSFTETAKAQREEMFKEAESYTQLLKAGKPDVEASRFWGGRQSVESIPKRNHRLLRQPAVDSGHEEQLLVLREKVFTTLNLAKVSSLFNEEQSWRSWKMGFCKPGLGTCDPAKAIPQEIEKPVSQKPTGCQGDVLDGAVGNNKTLRFVYGDASEKLQGTELYQENRPTSVSFESWTEFIEEDDELDDEYKKSKNMVWQWVAFRTAGRECMKTLGDSRDLITDFKELRKQARMARPVEDPVKLDKAEEAAMVTQADREKTGTDTSSGEKGNQIPSPKRKRDASSDEVVCALPKRTKVADVRPPLEADGTDRQREADKASVSRPLPKGDADAAEQASRDLQQQHQARKSIAPPEERQTHRKQTNGHIDHFHHYGHHHHHHHHHHHSSQQEKKWPGDPNGSIHSGNPRFDLYRHPGDWQHPLQQQQHQQQQQQQHFSHGHGLHKLPPRPPRMPNGRDLRAPAPRSSPKSGHSLSPRRSGNSGGRR